MNFLLIFSTIFQLTRIGADEISRGPRPRPIVAKLSCPKWGTVIDGYCLWKGSHFPVKRDVADNLCKRSGGQVFLPIEKPKNLLLQVVKIKRKCLVRTHFRPVFACIYILKLSIRHGTIFFWSLNLSTILFF